MSENDLACTRKELHYVSELLDSYAETTFGSDPTIRGTERFSTLIKNLMRRNPDADIFFFSVNQLVDQNLVLSREEIEAIKNLVGVFENTSCFRDFDTRGLLEKLLEMCPGAKQFIVSSSGDS